MSNKEKENDILDTMYKASIMLWKMASRGKSSDINDLSEEDAYEYRRVIYEHDSGRLALLKIENDKLLKKCEEAELLNLGEVRTPSYHPHEGLKLVPNKGLLDGERLYCIDQIFRKDPTDQNGKIELKYKYDLLVDETYKFMREKIEKDRKEEEEDPFKNLREFECIIGEYILRERLKELDYSADKWLQKCIDEEREKYIQKLSQDLGIECRDLVEVNYITDYISVQNESFKYDRTREYIYYCINKEREKFSLEDMIAQIALYREFIERNSVTKEEVWAIQPNTDKLLEKGKGAGYRDTDDFKLLRKREDLLYKLYDKDVKLALLAEAESVYKSLLEKERQED